MCQVQCTTVSSMDVSIETPLAWRAVRKCRCAPKFEVSFGWESGEDVLQMHSQNHWQRRLIKKLRQLMTGWSSSKCYSPNGQWPWAPSSSESKTTEFCLHIINTSHIVSVTQHQKHMHSFCVPIGRERLISDAVKPTTCTKKRQSHHR